MYRFLVETLVCVLLCAVYVRGAEVGNNEIPLFIHSGGSSVIVLDSHIGCQIFDRSKQPPPPVAEGAQVKYYKVSAELLSELAELCRNNKKDFHSPTQLISDVRENTRFIYPGTKYCGSGNASTGKDDLGEYVATDSCCQEHDNCQDYIPARSCSRKIGLCNRTPFTRSSCACDEKFRQCLLTANETAGNEIGKLYFNVFGLQCYRQDHPVVKCKAWGGFLNMHCQEYKLDYSKPKVWQFFDSPKFVPATQLDGDRSDEDEAIKWLTLVFNPQ